MCWLACVITSLETIIAFSVTYNSQCQQIFSSFYFDYWFILFFLCVNHSFSGFYTLVQTCSVHLTRKKLELGHLNQVSIKPFLFGAVPLENCCNMFTFNIHKWHCNALRVYFLQSRPGPSRAVPSMEISPFRRFKNLIRKPPTSKSLDYWCFFIYTQLCCLS